MKKKVKQYAQQIQQGTQDRRHVLKDFSRMLDNQVKVRLYHVLCDNHVSSTFNCTVQM